MLPCFQKQACDRVGCAIHHVYLPLRGTFYCHTLVSLRGREEDFHAQRYEECMGLPGNRGSYPCSIVASRALVCSLIGSAETTRTVYLIVVCTTSLCLPRD